MGVQMMGGSNPFVRQMASIFGRIEALAMCVQFQVSK
jgi:hypothetical protein